MMKKDEEKRRNRDDGFIRCLTLRLPSLLDGYISRPHKVRYT